MKRRLTDRQVIAILGARGTWGNARLARHFHVSKNTIWQIWSGVTYKDLWRRFHGA